MALKLANDELSALRKLGKPELTTTGRLRSIRANKWAFALVAEWRQRGVDVLRRDGPKQAGEQ